MGTFVLEPSPAPIRCDASHQGGHLEPLVGQTWEERFESETSSIAETWEERFEGETSSIAEKREPCKPVESAPTVVSKPRKPTIISEPRFPKKKSESETSTITEERHRALVTFSRGSMAWLKWDALASC